MIRSSELGCGMCIENQLKILQKYSKLIGESNIVVITTHNILRKIEVFKKLNNIKFKVFSCANLGFPLEKISEKSFVFLVGKDLKIRQFYIPEVTKPDLSENYYSEITKLYFKNKSLIN